MMNNKMISEQLACIKLYNEHMITIRYCEKRTRLRVNASRKISIWGYSHCFNNTCDELSKATTLKSLIIILNFNYLVK